MGFLFRKAPAAVGPEFTGYQTQTSVNTMVIPLIYGTPRVSCNVIDVKNFHAVPVKQSKSGGKGLVGGGKGANQTTYNYYCDALLAVGEAPASGLNGPIIIFLDQGVYPPNGTPGALTFFNGANGQQPWSYWVMQYPSAARSYPRTAYFGGANFPMDATATLPQMNFLMAGMFQGTAPLFRAVYTVANASAPQAYGGSVAINMAMDADPALVVYDFLTDPLHGAYFPARFVDPSLFSTANATNPSVGDPTFQTYCQAVGFGFSLALSAPESALNILNRWCEVLSVAAVWTGNTLKLVPYYDSYATQCQGYDGSNPSLPPKYFNPNITVLFSLTDDDFVATTDGTPPVTYERMDSADVFNKVRLDFKDRFNLWNDNVAEAQDENDVDVNVARPDNLQSAQEFTHMAYAQLACQLRVNRNVSVRNRYTFKLSWEYCTLEPMDVVKVTDVALGLSAFPVRIVSVEEDDRYELTVVAEEFPVGSQSGLLYPYGAGTGPTGLNTNQPSAKVSKPVFFEPTQAALQYFGLPMPSIVLGVTAGPNGAYDPNFGGCDVYASLDNQSYSYQGTFQGRSTMGALLTPLPAYASTNPDNATGLITTAPTTTSSQVLNFASVPSSVAAGQYVTDITGGHGAYIAPGTTVLSTTTSTVTISAPPVYQVPKNDTIYFGDFLQLDLTESHGTLTGMTAQQASNYQGISVVLDASGSYELVSFTNAYLTGPYTYTLTGIYRGLFNTAPSAHAAGAQFLFLANELFFQEQVPQNWYGQTLYFKFPVFNIFNQEHEPLSDCDVYQYTPTGVGGGTGTGSSGYPVFTVQVITANSNVQL